MDKKLSQLRDCFCKESCKIAVMHGRIQQHWNDAEKVNTGILDNDLKLKGRILEAEIHKDLLDPDFQCSRDHCWECTNTLC